MNPLTLEWIEKAEGDFVTARRELRARTAPNYDAVCFHSQQTAEKYIKALLQETEINIPKTHQLMDLLALCIKVDPTVELLYSDLIILEGYSVRYRYPGETAEKSEARIAFKSAQAVRLFIRTGLGLSI
jgi:HEPN domain-containing protein